MVSYTPGAAVILGRNPYYWRTAEGRRLPYLDTIRLEIQNRRPEIEVTKLVGGTNAFVRRPFLYTGVLYGLVAGLLAWGIVALIVAILERPAASLAAAYGSSFALHGPARAALECLLAGAPALGLVGAALAAGRQLARIEPRST